VLLLNRSGENMLNKFNIILTPNALSHFQKITNGEKAIRLGLKKSGCSGYSYVMNTADLSAQEPQELLIPIQKIPFLVQQKDLNSFENCIVDYKKEGLNYKLIFDNPNAINHCGCGESFSLPNSNI
jgi:iron-sulfur cluster assembly protein